MLELHTIVEQYAEAFKRVDSDRPTNPPYRPGIGPFGERNALQLALSNLANVYPQAYRAAGPMRYPGGKSSECDLVIPGEWAIEWKLLRPFGDNGKPAEHWSENVLHPYAGNTSSIGDCLKLLNSTFSERKAVMVYGFEHTPAEIPLEPAIRAFEDVAKQVTGIKLGSRCETTFTGLVHPVFQQGAVFGWEVLGLQRPD